jgi:hypothetical protein
MKNQKYLLASLCAAGAILVSLPLSGQPQPSPDKDDLRATLEMFRSDVNTTKIRTLNRAMKLTAPEADKFWPIYRQYEVELAALGDRKLALIRDFATHQNNGTLNDESAKTMADQWLTNSQDRLDLWKKYYQKISEAVSPVRGAQFLQIEHQMSLFIDINIASAMPMVTASPTPAP